MTASRAVPEELSDADRSVEPGAEARHRTLAGPDADVRPGLEPGGPADPDQPAVATPARGNPAPSAGPDGPWRLRVTEHALINPSLLLAHPDNYKAHPDRQHRAISAAIDEIGFVGEVHVSKRSGRILDGHMRVAEAIRAQQPLVPVGYVDCADDADELRILATYDPIGAMALQDADKLGSLARRASLRADPLLQMLAGIAGTRPPSPPETPGETSGRVVGRSFGPQGGPASGGKLGLVPDLIWPLVIECQDEMEQSEVLVRLEEEYDFDIYMLEGSPSAIAERRPSRSGRHDQ